MDMLQYNIVLTISAKVLCACDVYIVIELKKKIYSELNSFFCEEKQRL